MSAVEKEWFDVKFRVDHVLMLPQSIIHEALPDLFDEEFCRDLEEDMLPQVVEKLPYLASFVAKPEDVHEVPAEEIALSILNNGTFGFLVYLNQPVEIRNGKYSWGHTTGGWIFVTYLEELLEEGKKWSEERSRRLKTRYAEA